MQSNNYIPLVDIENHLIKDLEEYKEMTKSIEE
jgi:hypothetical protein